jgi:hypothetical protein
MSRSVSRLSVVFLLALVGAFGLVSPASAAVSNEHVHVRQTDAPTPTNVGPDLNPPQQTDPAIKDETKRKLWIGAIALALFALVYYRNKRRWNKWRKARKAAAG